MIGVEVKLGDIGGEWGESVGGATILGAKREECKIAWDSRSFLVLIHLVRPVKWS